MKDHGRVEDKGFRPVARYGRANLLRTSGTYGGYCTGGWYVQYK